MTDETCTSAKLLTYKEAADILGVSVKVVRGMVDREELAKWKSGPGQTASVRVTKASLDAHLAAHDVTTGATGEDVK